MIYASKLSYFANFRRLNCLILQFFAYQTVLFCEFSLAERLSLIKGGAVFSAFMVKNNGNAPRRGAFTSENKSKTH